MAPAFGENGADRITGRRCGVRLFQACVFCAASGALHALHVPNGLLCTMHHASHQGLVGVWNLCCAHTPTLKSITAHKVRMFFGRDEHDDQF